MNYTDKFGNIQKIMYICSDFMYKYTLPAR